MDGRSSKGPDVAKLPLESVPKTNKSVPRGLLYRELGFKQKQGRVSSEFQRAAEDRLVVKNHEELPCELPDGSRSTFLMVFSPDGTKVASTHGNHNVYVTDLNTGKNVNTLSGHPRTPWCITFHPSSNQILASGCLGGQVRVWDLHGGSEMWTAESQTVIASLAFHPTDQILVIATYNELLLWDWSQPVPFTKCYTSNEREKVRYVAFDPLGHKLITGISNAPHNQTQWDRVAAPACQGVSLASTSHSYHPRSPVFPPDRERRMAVCYRSLVEQYEQLVQRYYNLSRSRTPTMDRGTDPMDLSELSPAGLQSGSSRTQSHTQMGCIHVRGMNRFLIHDNSSSSGDNSSANGSENSSSAAGASSGGPCCSVRSEFFNRFRNILRRHAQERPTAFNRLELLSDRVDAERTQAVGHCSTDRRDSARSVSPPARRFELDNSNNARHGVHHEYGEQRFDVERTSVSHSSDVQRVQTAVDPARRRRSLDGERQIVPDSTRDHQPAGTRSSLSLEQPVSFTRFHSQALPPSACPPERPRRFFVSQRSAFHPRVPRGDQHPHSESPFTARPPSGIQTPRSSYVLHRRLRDAYHLQNFQGDNEMSTFDPLPHQALDSTSDVGVRYGIQLLSRHIDNMQRLCRARLEILQLQQIRRMWEDLQQQIRSLHVAVRDSTSALTGTRNVLGSRGRRMFRLYSHPRDKLVRGVSGDVQLRQNNQRSGDSEAGATEQGPHIPSVSQMLKSAHISDVGPTSNSSQIPAPVSGASATHKQPVPSEQGASNQDHFRTGTLDPLHPQFEILTKMKLTMDEKNCIRKEGETSISNVAGTSKNVGTTHGDIAEPVGAAANRFISSDGEQSVSQCAKPVSFGNHEGSAEGPTSPDLPESVKSIRTSDLLCEGDNMKVKKIRNSPCGECSKTASPYKKQRGDGVDSSERSAPMDISCNSQSGNCMSATGEGVCASSSSSTPVVPPVNTTIATTATTVTSSAVDPSTVLNSSAVKDGSSEASGHLPSNSWCRYGSANATINTNVSTDMTTSTAATAANSQHQRLWRVSRRVYLRRPRLLALGPRSRTMFRQLSSNNASSLKNYSAGIFRSASVDISCNSQSDNCMSATGEGVCASSSSSSSTPVVPPVNTTIATTATTVTSSSAVDPSTVQSSSAVKDGSSETSGHLPSNSWCRYGRANASINTNVSTDTNPSTASTAASSQHQRLWRVSRRVYLRRPRLLTLGPRSRTIFRQLGSNSASSLRNYSAGIFRHHESGRRPWLTQSSPSRSQHTRLSSRGTNTSAQVGTHETTLSNFAEECGSNGSRASSDDHKQVNSDALVSSSISPEVSVSDQGSSSSGKAPQSTHKRKHDKSTENDIQPGPSRQQEHVSFHASSLANKEGDTSGTGIGKDIPSGTRKGAGRDAGTGESDSSQQTQCEPTVYGCFRAVTARLESLINQRREQQESLRQENLSGRQSQQTDMWELRDRHLWFRGDANSGSDSDSNPESDRHQVWEWPSAADRLIMAIENETSNSSMFGSRRGCSGALDEDWEWTRESTRLRARQVLGLMVESLTQFFEENGLSGSASHAVLDEQLYNLYILLQLALELTDLLLAQLVSTRRELEHQWMHRLHSPVALDATTPAGQHQLRRSRGTERPQESHSLWQEYLGHERPYRRLLRYRHHPFIQSDMTTQLDGAPGTVRGVRSSPRRLNCYSRRGSHTGIAATLRMCREVGSRPLMRGAVPRRANIAFHLPPYTRSAGIRSAYTSRETGHHLRTFEEPHTRGSSEIRSPHIMATGDNSVPIASMPLSINQQNNDGHQQQQLQQPQGQQQQQQLQQAQGQLQHPQGQLQQQQLQQPQGQQQQQQQQLQQPQGQQQQQQDTFTVPLVQVNDVPIPDTSVLNQPQPRQRPQSPPPHPSHLRNPFIQQQQQQSQHTQSPLRHLGDSWRYPVNPGDNSWRSGWRSHFLHPRYVGQNPFSEDQDEPLVGPTLENINIIRDSFIITDAPMSPNHRIQVWDFTKFRIPDISNAEKNVVVAECRIQNDASVDVSNDGRLLVTLLPTGRLSSTDMLGVYSLEWESLGQCLYTTSFEQSAVSVSLSPAGHHLLVGFASRRVALLPTDRHTMAQIFRLEGGLPGRTIGARGRLCHIRDIEQDREQGYMSLNCIRWAPSPGQGLVYGTNTGKLKVLQ